MISMPIKLLFISQTTCGISSSLLPLQLRICERVTRLERKSMEEKNPHERTVRSYLQRTSENPARTQFSHQVHQRSSEHLNFQHLTTHLATHSGGSGSPIASIKFYTSLGRPEFIEGRTMEQCNNGTIPLSPATPPRKQFA